MTLSTGTIAAISLSLLAITALLLYSYVRSREEAHYQHLRYHSVTNQLKNLSAYVSKFKKDVKADFVTTDNDIKEQAEKVMKVIGDAIAREAVVVDKSFAENKKAVAALHALVIASTDSLKELVGKLDVEEKEQVLQFMKAMEARHVEIVSYLSDGGLDKVANLLATSLTPEGFQSHEGFQPSDIADKLKTLGIELTDQQLAELHQGIMNDMTVYKMTPKESIYIRLSHLAPVVAKAKTMKSGELAGKIEAEDARHRSITSTIVSGARGDLFDRIQELDNTHREAIRAAAADVTNNVRATNADLGNKIGGVADRLNASNRDVIDRLNSVSADIVNADRSSAADAISNLKTAINAMSADVKSTVVSASNDITGKTANSLTAAASNITSAVNTSAANLKSSIDNSNVTATNIYRNQDAAITEARKWSTDNLANLTAIKDAIAKLQLATTTPPPTTTTTATTTVPNSTL